MITKFDSMLKKTVAPLFGIDAVIGNFCFFDADIVQFSDNINCAIYRKGSNIIKWYLRDCVKKGSNFLGSNGKITDVRLSLFDYMWTYMIVLPTENGWNRTVSELVAADVNGITEIQETSHVDYQKAINTLSWLSSKSYQDVENYITTNVTDLASARTFLIQLSKIVLALIKAGDKK